MDMIIELQIFKTNLPTKAFLNEDILAPASLTARTIVTRRTRYAGTTLAAYRYLKHNNPEKKHFLKYKYVMSNNLIIVMENYMFDGILV